MAKNKALVKPHNKSKTDKNASRSTLVDALKGKYAWIPYSSEDFSRDKEVNGDMLEWR